MVLGDDVVIFNEVVAGEYSKLIQSIGVQISAMKTVSPQTEAVNGVEFASKLVVNGINISPLPLGLLFQEDSLRLSNLLVSTIETIYALGGPLVTEQFLICIPTWLAQVSVKDSDFKAPSVISD